MDQPVTKNFVDRVVFWLFRQPPTFLWLSSSLLLLMLPHALRMPSVAATRANMANAYFDHEVAMMLLAVAVDAFMLDSAH